MFRRLASSDIAAGEVDLANSVSLSCSYRRLHADTHARHMVSAAVRGIVQTGLSLIVFPAEAKAFTRPRQIGTVLIVVGSTLYAYDEATKKKNQTSSVVREKEDAQSEVNIPLLDEKVKHEV